MKAPSSRMRSGMPDLPRVGAERVLAHLRRGLVRCAAWLGWASWWAAGVVVAATAASSPTSIVAGAEQLEARVAPHQGRNAIWVNGRPVVAQMYSGTEHSRQTWTGRARQSLEEFTALGYDIIQTDCWLKYSLRPDGTFDMAGIRRQLAGILEVNPRAMLVVRINVSAPRWWLDAHPAETCKVTAGPGKNEFGGNSAESLSSEKYAAFAQEQLRRFLTELQATPEAARVIGFHLGGGVYGEWHYYGIFNEPDASEPMRRRFRAFAEGMYGSLERINAAWSTDFGSLPQLTVPSFDRRHEVADGDYRDPRRDRYVIDYYDCQQATVGALVEDLARVIKVTWRRPTLVGVFYGYFYGGFTVGAQASQLDIARLFRSPHVDYFAGPYASRSMDGTGVARTLVQSVALNGKVWMTEHDGSTHLGDIGQTKFPDAPRDETESIARMRRNFMHGIAEGSGQWWYDFGPRHASGGWSTPAMLAEAKELLGFAQAALDRPFERPSDVLVVYDMPAFYHVRPARVDALTKKTTEALTDSLLGAGAAVDRIFLMDLAKVDLARYKLVVFGNTFVLSAQDRALIKAKVLTPGRTVVFMSGAGYSDGAVNDVGLIGDLVGMRVERAAAAASQPRVRLDDQALAVDDRGLRTRFRVIGPVDREIGHYADGSIAAAVKNVGGCRVYYFGVPLKAPLGAFRALLRDCQVRTYVEGTTEKDCVVVGGGMIGIYSVQGGVKYVKPMNGERRRVELPPYSALYFDLQTGDALNALPASRPR